MRYWIRCRDGIRYTGFGNRPDGSKGPHLVENMTLYIILGVVALILISIIMIFNGLVAKRQTVNEAFSGIDVQLKLRRELIPNLVETVKGYAAHEKSTLDAVIAARTAAANAQGPAAIGAAEGASLGCAGPPVRAG